MRAAVCAGLLYDINMVNCRPALLLQLAKRHAVDVPMLTSYVRAQDSVLSEIERHYWCGREAAEKLLSVARILGNP